MALTSEEYQKILDLMGREPNDIELGMFEVMWSEHCSYKNSKALLKQLPTEGKYVLQGPGENAGVVDLGDGKALAFKVESHNHPSAVEPYQGAMTGVGGIIRDILSMGARPVALLNSLRFGPIHSSGLNTSNDNSDINPAVKASQYAHEEISNKINRARFLFNGVVSGIGGYGNCVGVPTVGGEVYFDSSYQGNPLVNAMCVGLLNSKDMQQGKMEKSNNALLLVGARTGRDGILGASFASQILSGDELEDRPSVQVGDPFTGKLLIESSLELLNSPGVVGVQDLGAGGLVSAVSEMASSSNTGAYVDVSQVPLREENMTPYEIMLSESQERMLFVVEPNYIEELSEKANYWGLSAVEIGKVTEDKKLTIYNGDTQIANLNPQDLTDNAPEYIQESWTPEHLQNSNKAPQQNEVSKTIETILNSNHLSHEQVILNMLGTPNIGDKSWIYHQFDHTVRTNTVVSPGLGSGIIRIKGTDKGVALTIDGNSRYVHINPYLGGQIAVAEAARNLAVTGATPLGISNCLNFGNPENPEIYYQLKQAIHGMSLASKTLDVPVTGGNVSLYNEGEYGEIKPTPVIGMVGLLPKIDKLCPRTFQSDGDVIILLGPTSSEFGGSELFNIIDDARLPEINENNKMLLDWESELKYTVPNLNLEIEQNIQKFLINTINEGLLNSAQDLSEGGLSMALAKSATCSGLGANIKLHENLDLATWLYSESQSRVLITVSYGNYSDTKDHLQKFKLPFEVLGNVANQDHLQIKWTDQKISLSLEQLHSSWSKAITKNME